MIKRATYCCLLTLLVLLAACNKAPDGVIKENVMAKLMVDLNKADTYVDEHRNEFPNDSMRMMLKQSIFAKYDVDQELYDHSLEWYAKNMDVYTDVCDRATRQLEEEKKKLAKRNQDQGPSRYTEEEAQATQRQQYANHGDTADVWTGKRAWLLTAGMGRGVLRWDMEPDREHLPGDKYQLMLKVQSNSHGMSVTLACDYNDGSTTTITRPLATTDWNTVSLQTDTLKQVRRVYGYIRYKMKPQTIAVVDSVSLLRTHFDRKTYGLIGTQITINRNGDNKQPSISTTRIKPVIPDAQKLRDQEDDQTRATFRPKPGMNKSSREPHVRQSPNAAHLPKKQP